LPHEHLKLRIRNLAFLSLWTNHGYRLEQNESLTQKTSNNRWT